MKSDSKKTHHIQVRPRAGTEDRILTGNNTEVLMDGQLLKCVSGMKFEVNASGVAKVTLEILATVDINGNVALEGMSNG